MNNPNDTDNSSRRLHPLERGYAAPTAEPEQTAPRERLVFNMEPASPVITYALIAINIVIFVLGSLSLELQELLFLGGWNDALAVFNEGEYYRLFSAMFLHAGIGHLFFNMYGLYILGIETEQMYGRWHYLVIYFLGGVSGSVLSAALGNPQVPSVGASGAVFALLGTQVLYFYRHRATLGSYGQGVLRQYVILLGINLVLGFTIARIDNLGHIGGLIGGAILGWLLSPDLIAKQGYDRNGIPTSLVNVEQREGGTTIAVVYALGLIGVVLLANILRF